MLAGYNPTAGAGGTPLYGGPSASPDDETLAKLKAGLGGALGATPTTTQPQVAGAALQPYTGTQPTAKAPGATAPAPVPTAAPAAPAPTFAQMQANGVARPAPPPAAPVALDDAPYPVKPTDSDPTPNPNGPTPPGQPDTPGIPTQPGGTQPPATTPTTPTGTNPAFDPSQIPLYSQMSDALKQWLANPSRYTSQTAQDTYKSLGGLLDQDYAAQGKQLNDQLASRGISDSSIAGQRYSDLSTEQARAKANLAQSIETQQAETNGQDMSSALSSALVLGGLGVNQQALQQGGIMQTLALLSQYGLLSPDFLAKLGVSGGTH